MSTREERLKEVYAYLRRHKGIYYQKDFADAIGVQRPGLSAALNGNEAYLTDSLFKKICKTYPGVFNFDYLINGEGILLATKAEEREVIKRMNETPALTLQAGVESLLTLASQLIKENESLRRDMQKSISELHDIIKELKVKHYVEPSTEYLKAAEKEEKLTK